MDYPDYHFRREYLRWYNALTPDQRVDWQAPEPFDQAALAGAYRDWHSTHTDRLAAGDFTVSVADRDIAPPLLSCAA